MALDVYVGSLTRYYAGDWENVAERKARERSMNRPPGPVRAVEDRAAVERIRTAVLHWRETLGASLGANATMSLDWDESADAPFFVGRPGWDGFGSLVLWAAYAEHPGLPRPVVLPEEWDDDPALMRCNAEGMRSRFSHLVRNVELWLPSPFDFILEGQDVDGRRIVIGSSSTLDRQLADLNGATWKAGAHESAGWAHIVPTSDASLERRARYAFAVLVDLVRQAATHRLVMKLDF
ncbi:MAG: hypothetical protein KIT25_02405 [Enhydrobacter sp.]|nr:MAG: hypothetical protein KIT25_02405 [Enhydrobacter sp.]